MKCYIRIKNKICGALQISLNITSMNLSLNSIINFKNKSINSQPCSKCERMVK